METDVSLDNLRPGDFRILVAEDNPVNQKIMLKIMEKLGFFADVVGNGAEVVSAAKPKFYDIILMDQHMPVLRGVHATKP